MIFIGCALVANAETIYMPCRNLPDGMTLQKLEAGLESYRRGELPNDIENALTCKAALPVLKKYALDADPRIRGIVTNALGRVYYDFNRSFYPEPFRILISQIEAFPVDESGFPVGNAARYPCFRFKTINARRLTVALIERFKSRDNEFNRDEIEILGCLSRRETRAKEFLLELRKPDFPTRLDRKEREEQREFLRDALAEAGIKEMEERVLNKIDQLIASGESERIQNSLPVLKHFTNRRIVRRYIDLLNDKREITVANYDNFKRNDLKITIRDFMVMVFTVNYGRETTGEYGQAFRSYSDVEIEKIYRRVDSFARRKVFTAYSPKND